MLIKKFHTFNENNNIWDNVNFSSEFRLYPDEDEFEKFNIIKKYFYYEKVTGTDDWETGVVDLSFDDGKFTIKGKYDNNTETTPALFTIGSTSYNFVFHYHGTLGGQNMEKFEQEIKNIYDDENSYSICVASEGYVTQVLQVVSSKENAISASEEYSIYIVKGKQIDGKQLGKTLMNNEKDESRITKIK